jgi:hypothetical protein
MSMATQSSVVAVGAGRGFVVSGERHLGEEMVEDRYIVTAAHCLPFFPPCASSSTFDERTYPSLVGPLGKEKTVWVECLFVDPIGDIAVLGEPDCHAMIEESDGYREMIEEITPFAVSEAPREGSASLLSLAGRWFQCRVRHANIGPLFVFEASEDIVGGMSGSPIVAADGSAIGIVTTSGGDAERRREGPGPTLMGNLPGWLLQQFGRAANKPAGPPKKKPAPSSARR